MLLCSTPFNGRSQNNFAKNTLREEIFAEFNLANEMVKISKFIFDIPNLLLLKKKKKEKKSNFAEYNFANRAKLREIKFRENFFS